MTVPLCQFFQITTSRYSLRKRRLCETAQLVKQSSAIAATKKIGNPLRIQLPHHRIATTLGGFAMTAPFCQFFQITTSRSSSRKRRLCETAQLVKQSSAIAATKKIGNFLRIQFPLPPDHHVALFLAKATVKAQEMLMTNL